MAQAADRDEEDGPLRFRDLGTVTVDRGGLGLPVSGRLLQAALSVLLIHANQRVSVDALVSALWGDRAHDRHEETLKSHMWRLRQALEPDRRRGQPFTTVVHDSSGYRLLVTTDQVDSMQFSNLAADAQHLLARDEADRALQRCEEALALWRGRPFTPLADEGWAQAAVGRLEEVRGQLVECRIDSLLAVGEPERALLAVEDALAEHPLRERLWAQRMNAAYRAGRTADALQAFSSARRLLLEELGIEPGAELRDLQARILAGDPSLGGIRPAASAAARERRPAPQRPEVHLPGRRSSLVGRDTELETLVGRLRQDRLVTVVGPPGVGKTRLTVEAAHEVASEFVDGVWFVDLTVAKDAGQVFDLVGSALGVANDGTPAAALHSFVRGRRMLLVLDNCERVLGDVADLVDAQLVDGSELTIAATSREPLGVDGETVWPLRPLQLPLPIEGPVSADDVMRLLDSPAVMLFVQRLSTVDPDASVDGEDLRRAAAICAAVDGLPLSIELAAAQGEAYTLAEIADRVAADPSDLSRVDRRGAHHHGTVRDAVEWSYAMLPSVEAAVHRAISVVPGPFTAQLAAALTPEVPGAVVRDALRGLLHRSMLLRPGPTRVGRPSRFAQLETVRAHAAAADDGAADERERLRDEWVAALVGARPRLGHPDENEWFGRLDDDLAALRSTLQHTLAETPSELGVRIASRLNHFWYSRSMSLEGGRWLEHAVAHSDLVGPFEATIAVLTLASYRARTGRQDLAAPLLARAVTDPAELTREQALLVGESLSTYCSSAVMAPSADPFDEQAAQVRALARATGDEVLDLLADLTEILAIDPYVEPESVLAGSTAVYERALSIRNGYVARISAGQATLAATLLGEIDLGLQWSDRALAQHHEVGIRFSPVVADARANLLALAGANHAAARLYAAGRAHARRYGMHWPTEQLTQKLYEQARSALPGPDFQLEQRAGIRLTLRDLDRIGVGGEADQAVDLPAG
ncbi:MAG TPA: BTAD domain-containing putative transcriptional regulator [Mycobacteriales bacterium]|nr:BTAD domain-containing putative transcriptional regulator [Mycobacteriales bacterium]